MTSAISYSLIDANYPVAGQDNNSQGFRDNFSYIKNGLQTAAGEITNLQNDTAKTNAVNDFNGYLISNAETNMLYGKVYNFSGVTTDTIVDVRNGEYQSLVVGNNVTVTLREWPASDRYAKIVLEFRSDGNARTVTFASEGGGIIKKSNFPSATFTVPADTSSSSIVEVWTTTGGTTVYINYIGTFA